MLQLLLNFLLVKLHFVNQASDMRSRVGARFGVGVTGWGRQRIKILLPHALIALDESVIAYTLSSGAETCHRCL